MTLKKRAYYVRRCHELSIIAGKATSPNPNVGAVLVDADEIIGEGWHEQYGTPHAEINALDNVALESKSRIAKSTMYVSLEPCSIHGQTPPCTDAILRKNIQEVVISARDETEGVREVSEYILKQKNIKLTYGVEEELGNYIARPRNTFVTKKRPYIVIKWAQSADGFISQNDERTTISNPFTRRYVHQIRSKVDAILVGRRTVEIDNPQLTNRFFSGGHPLRIILGKVSEGKEPSYHVFNDGRPTLQLDKSQIGRPNDNDFLIACCKQLHEQSIMTMLVEGGRTTIEGFLKQGLWDECHIITNTNTLGEGLKAPLLPDAPCVQEFKIHNDHIAIFHNL